MYFLQPKQKKFLETLNPLMILVFFYVVLISRTTVDSLSPSVLKNWDILLPFIAFFGQRRAIAEGLTLAILSAHFYSLSSAAPVGFFVLHYLVLFFAARGISYVIYPDRWVTVGLALALLSLLSRLVSIPVGMFFEHRWGFSFWNHLVLGTFLNTVLGYFIYLALEITDRLTFKVVVSGTQLPEVGR